MSTRNVDTYRTAHQAFNRRDFDAVAALLADQFSYEDRARGTTFRGPDGFTEFMRGWATAFSTAAVTEPTYIDGGDTVVATFLGRGINDGPLGPHPPTGHEMTLPFCEVMRFDDRGRIMAGAIYYDQLSLLTQLGLAGRVAPA